MNLDVRTLAIFIPPLILIEGFFSGSEIALLSADRLSLKKQAKQGNKSAKFALSLMDRPEQIISTTLLMTSLCVITISSLLTLYFLDHAPAHGELFAVLLTSPLVVLFGELIPKTIYQRHSSQIAPWVARPVWLVFCLFFPLTRLLALYTSRLSRLVGPIEELLTGKRRTTRDELQSMLLYGKKESEIKTSEKRMIKRIFDFKDTEAKHALIPLVRVEAIEETSTCKMALQRYESHRHSRMPVYAGRVDNIIGVLEASDLLGAIDLNQPIRNYVSSAHYVAETQSLEELMLEMRRDDLEMVVVVDEYGGAVGVLTFEDIIEEIVGEINDEYDSSSALYKELSETGWLVQAKMEVVDLNEKLKLGLPEGDYETMSGFLLQQFGRIPQTKDELFFDTPTGTYKFTIRKASQRAIETVLVERLAERKEAPET
jgi:CBS domain containing-hemolysin-like protein